MQSERNGPSSVWPASTASVAYKDLDTKSLRELRFMLAKMNIPYLPTDDKQDLIKKILHLS